MEALRRRIVLVCPFAPARDGQHGGVRALRGIAGELTRRHEVVLVHLDRGDLDPVVAERCVAVHRVGLVEVGKWTLRARGALSIARGRSLKAAASSVPGLQRVLREVVSGFHPDVVQVEHGFLGDVFAAAPASLRVVTIHDPAASLREGLALRDDGLPFAHRLDAGAARREERRVLSHADAAVVFTERDRQLVAGAAPVGTEVVAIPLGWDVPTRAADPHGGDPPTLLFVGNFNHPPNVAAAVTVVREILPRVRASHPEVVAEIVGASPPPEVLSLAGRGVRVTGPVPTVFPHLDQAAVVLAPLTIGGGVRIKVLEALAAGKAVVASSRAAEGVTARPGEALVVADGVAEMAAAVVHLLEDGTARLGVASRARAWAVRELSWSSMVDRYEQLYARLERRPSARS